ncbi:MAG: alpha-glucuronidase [Anaerolineae bacterium]|nr:alpha-glucuronidase [Anaerolineae bacterium]
MNNPQSSPYLKPEDGYELWLRYTSPPDPSAYRAAITQLVFDPASPVLRAAHSDLTRALASLLGVPVPLAETATQAGALVVGTPDGSRGIAGLGLGDDLARAGDEGFVICRADLHGNAGIAIAANRDIGVLYGVFHFLRLLQTGKPLDKLRIVSAPKIKRRILHHWDNLDGTIERGYAGYSLWDWHKLPDYISPRYIDYARANASVGINGAVLTNANAKALSLTPAYLLKAAALAEVFRPYGIRIFLSARVTAPMELGTLTTADPLDAGVRGWWKAKVDEIYDLIPDFGGFVVKANSEGQPGPRDYGRSQEDGANALAEPMLDKGGIVCWRAFIYDDHDPDDRHKQAYTELVPVDGTFAENVVLQVKNGAIDFQPREPYHPLFGAMPKTPLSLEVQITQEYLGCATHLAYLAPLFKETLDADTGCQGVGSTVARVVDGSLDGHALSALAGIANTGTDRNWCGHPFAAANWFAFGRLAWDHTLSAEAVADDWLRMTFSNDARFVEPATAMMIESREAVVDYMTPLGLHHLMARDHHFGPGPWVEGGRADWTSVYYHRADAEGIGFDRTKTGSNAVSQYCLPFRDLVANLETCPDEFLLWFHHVRWDYRMKSGRTLWDELCFKYNHGVESVRHMQQTWDALAGYVDAARFEHVRVLLRVQEQEARWWRDACLLYFQTFSRRPIPPEYESPAETLDYYRKLTHYFVPGIRERRFER